MAPDSEKPMILIRPGPAHAHAASSTKTDFTEETLFPLARKACFLALFLFLVRRQGHRDITVVVVFGFVNSSRSDSKIVQDSMPSGVAFLFRGGVYLQNLDLLAAASKQRTIEKCRLTYGSEITIIISVCCAGRSLDQIFPSLSLHPRCRGWFG